MRAGLTGWSGLSPEAVSTRWGWTMKIDDLLSMIDTPSNGDEMLNVFKTILMADDIPSGELAALRTGFLIGASYVMAKVKEGHLPLAAKEVVSLLRQWPDLLT